MVVDALFVFVEEDVVVTIVLALQLRWRSQSLCSHRPLIPPPQVADGAAPRAAAAVAEVQLQEPLAPPPSPRDVCAKSTDLAVAFILC